MEIIDEFKEEEKKPINSKISIFFTTLLFTPIFGGIPYCINLWKTNQKGKIFGAYITIVLCNFLITIPFQGMNLNLFDGDYITIIVNILLGLFIIGPLWRKHFDGIENKSTFPLVLFMLIAVLYIGRGLYVSWLGNNYSYVNPAPDYFITFGTYAPIILLILALTFRIVYIIFKRREG